MPPYQQKEGNGGEFDHHAERHEERNRHGIQQADEDTPQKPEDSIASGEKSVGRSTSLWRNHWSNGGRDNRLMHTDSQPSEGHTRQGKPEVSQEDEWREQCGEECERHQDNNAETVKKASKEQ